MYPSSFRRTYATTTNLAKKDIDLLSSKGHGESKSTTVAEGYNNGSIFNKKKSPKSSKAHLRQIKSNQIGTMSQFHSRKLHFHSHQLHQLSFTNLSSITPRIINSGFGNHSRT
ncbi:hypothetical protein Zmor_013701 [Zophobas morio]|uniref:Uncharacterized protein n=1 Tax=Zophobas morio TaxID=2755281 RepID=A0AA38MFB1_9CUCU|nr:hypothetical protein Zmor_013701 [Zophobas morio]